MNAYTSSVVASVIRDAGYTPIPLDINITNLGMNLDHLNKVISNDVGVLIITYLFGFPDNLDELLEFAKDKNIIVIEDCANSLDSFYDNRHTGSFGDLSFFSFRIGKPLGVGGELLCVNNTELLEQVDNYYNRLTKMASDISLYRIEIEKLLYRRPFYGLFTRPIRDLCKNTSLSKALFKGSAVDIYSRVSEERLYKMSERCFIWKR